MSLATVEKRLALGPILNDASYPLPVFQKLVGLNKYAMRSAKKRGLKTRFIGNRTYVRGCDWNDFLGTIEE